MRCKKCHRILTDQTSMERKLGPICYKKQQKNPTEQLELDFNPLFPPGISALEKHEIVNRVLGLK